MTQYLISFGAHAMDHIPDQDMPAVARAARAAVQEAINAGVYVSAGGLENQPASIVATDWAVTDGPYPQAIGGLTIVDVPLTRGRAAVGCQDRRRLPLRAGGPGDRGRPRTRRDAPPGRQPTVTPRLRLLEGGPQR